MTKEELYTEILQAKKHFTGKGFKEQLSHLLHKYDSSQNKEEVEETEPFDIEKWTPETVVKQKSGEFVRILCTNLEKDYPIVGAVYAPEGDSIDGIYQWNIKGIFQTGVSSGYDLVMVKPKPETEKYVIYRDEDGDIGISKERSHYMHDNESVYIKTVEIPL